MSTDQVQAKAQCTCGAVSIAISAAPRFRVLCHCSICRAFNNDTHADILVYSAPNVEPHEPGTIAFKRWRPPPNVRRGVCVSCGQPALERFKAPPFMNLTMIPTPMVAAPVPEPAAHIFYDKRVADVDDALPKHEGYWASQWAFMKLVMSTRK
ncbi:MAG: hypothetical protein AAFY69_08130 [Pseudomonadota bacterium]